MASVQRGASQRIQVQLTLSELEMLDFAAGLIGDDLDDMSLSANEKRAWRRAMVKIRQAKVRLGLGYSD